jgi:hypothetical protein
MPDKQNKSNKNNQEVEGVVGGMPQFLKKGTEKARGFLKREQNDAVAVNKTFEGLGFDMTQSSNGLLTATLASKTAMCVPQILFCQPPTAEHTPNTAKFTKNLQYLDLCLKMIEKEVRLKNEEILKIPLLAVGNPFTIYINATKNNGVKTAKLNEDREGHLSPFVMIWQLYKMTHEVHNSENDEKLVDTTGWKNWHTLIIQSMNESESERTIKLIEYVKKADTMAKYEVFLKKEYAEAYIEANDKQLKNLRSLAPTVKQSETQLTEGNDTEDEGSPDFLTESDSNDRDKTPVMSMTPVNTEEAAAEEEEEEEKAAEEEEEEVATVVESKGDKISKMQPATAETAEIDSKNPFGVGFGGKSKNQTFKRKNASHNKSKRRYTYGGRKAHNQRKQSRKDKQNN